MLRPRCTAAALSAAVAITLPACASGDLPPLPPYGGDCTIREVGSPAAAGAAAYAEHVTPTVGGGFGRSSLGITLTCVTPGLAGDRLVLILPNLRKDSLPASGEYRVRNPADPALTPAELRDPRLAWARVQRGTGRPLLFPGEAGRVVLTRVASGVMEGAYQVAFGRSDTAAALSGARREVEGTIAPDTLGTSVLARTVLEGAFTAGRAEADWRGQ